MSVSELIKTALPLSAPQSELNFANTVSNGTPIKSTNSITPLRARNSQAPPGTPGVTNNELSLLKGKILPKCPEEFYKDLQQFHERRGTPCTHLPKISGRVIDLHKLYSEVTERGGFAKVNIRDEWDEILPSLGLKDKCVNASAAIKHFYRRYLDKYERLYFFGEDPDKVDAADVSDSNDGGRSRRFFPSVLSGGSSLNAVPMSYNYRQHIVNTDRRRMYKMSLDLHKASPYEKLILSLLSPLPNEQDFAINVCTLMANENKHTLRLNECPKLLDVLLSHAGVFSDVSLRKLVQDVYKNVRRHSLLSFWRDLLYDKPQILELFNSDQMFQDDITNITDDVEDIDMEKSSSELKECLDMDFLNLGRGEGTQDYIGQRVQQILAILHNLSFFDENIQVLSKNRTFLRFIVMSANIRWGNIHNQALDIAGNVASELELQDPTSDELSRSLMATLCDGVEGLDRAVIINSLEILYKLSNKDSNEDHIHKCLSLKFYQTICMFLSLNDIMLLIYTLEAIYALSSMGARSCHLIMQVRGVVDQLVSLITVEAQSYGPDGCILMRVVETVPGNMLPMVAQNIANLQNVAVIQKQQHIPNVSATQHHEQPQLPVVDTQQQLPHQSVPLQTSTQEDEQYALSWLGATFERASTMDSRVEQQELYRMYLSHCQKSGKHSVVTHNQFPRLVRLIFSNNVGPVVVKRTDGTELPGYYYVAIRLRAQPLPVQVKISQTPQKCVDGKLAKVEIVSGRKLKKKLKPDSLDQRPHAELSTVLAKQDTENSPAVIGTTSNQVQENVTNPITTTNPQNPSVSVVDSTKTNEQQISETQVENFSNSTEEASSVAQVNVTPATSDPTSTMHTTNQTLAPQLVASSNASQPSSSLIKSLLANKVTQRQQKQKELIASTTSVQTIARPNVVATTAQPSPIKVASTSISALVNNPLMQNTPLKVGQTTIKPLNAQATMDKKHMMESAPPPLAPLSGGNASMSKDTSGRPVIIANQMLVEILDKKSTDPTMSSGIVKRKLDDSYVSSGDTSKRIAIDINAKDEAQVTPSKNAANLYAEMAASILEDEDLEDIPLMPTIKQPEITQQPLMIPAKIQAAPIQNVQRQLLFQSNQGPQLKLTQAGNITGTTQHIPTAMATIKTDQGLQTVPVILQQKPIEQQQPQLIQQVIQTQVPQQQQQTQYVLATNPQGQTYLVAQQSQAPTPPPQPTQTVLVTQTPQQQSAGTKTIIILQQQTVPSTQQQIIASTSGGGQKMIMTTPQGQQVLVTQRQPTTISSQTQQQIFINPQTGAATHIQHVPVSTVNTSIQQTNAALLQRQLIQTSSCTPQQTGQISPSLLSQLNHIPATIKIHNPNVQMASSNVQTTGQQHQLNTATLSRLGKSVSIVQTTPSLPPAGSIQIPQLQQHQSIIQQHIVSGPTEKRQVIVGGRTIEIKETVITQTQPPPQHSQLNSQTIITTQPPAQQQQQIRSISQQQQPHHPSIIQQKITVPVQQPQLMAVPKVSESMPSLIQSTVKYSTQPQQPTQITLQAPTQATVTTIKKPTTQLQQATMIAKQQQLPVQGNIQTQNIAQTPAKPFITSRPTTPSSAVTTAQIEANSSSATASTAGSESQQQQHQNTQKANTDTKHDEKSPVIPKANVSSTAPHPVQPVIDPNWLYICDWRNCPRRKFKSIQDLHHHACLAHCPDHLEAGAEIFCQWGPGPGLCDGIPRKRFSLMTHILDRHLTPENLRAAVQRRIQTGANNAQPTQPPVTIVRNVDASQRGSTASPALSTSSSSSLPSTGSSAIHAIKRHTADFVNPKELMDENEGPVTKSIRLTAALILRNLVTYTTNAKRNLRRYEAHLANVALSNVESSATISHILFELNN